MAELINDSGGLKLVLLLAQRHDDRFSGTAGVEAFDRRDGEYWPLVRLPVLRVTVSQVQQLISHLKECCAGARPTLSMQLGDERELAVSLASANGGGFVLEVGFDLSVLVREQPGLQSEPGRELALFRLSAPTDSVVRFGEALRAEAAPPAG